MDCREELDVLFAGVSDTGRCGPSDAKLLAEVKRETKGTSVGDDILMKERELSALTPPVMLRGRQAFVLVVLSFETDQDLGVVYGIEDIQHVKCRNPSLIKQLKQFSLDFRKVRLGLSLHGTATQRRLVLR